jgi:hypothetical protein
MVKARSRSLKETTPWMRFAGRFGVLLGAVLAFGGQFLISLRGVSVLATIVPGIALYASALVLVVLALRAGRPERAGAGHVETAVSPAGGAVSAAAADPERWLAGRVEWILLAILLVGGGWLRLYRIDIIPWGLNNDEAINCIEANEIAGGKPFETVTAWDRGLNRETMFHYLAALSFRNPGAVLNVLRALPVLFGLNPRFINDPMADAIFPLRAVAVAAGTLTLLAIYLFGRATFGRRAALLAAAFLAVSPWHLLYSRTGFRVILAPLFALLAAGLFLRARRTGKMPDHVLWGAALGLGFWTYTSFRAVALAIAAFEAIDLWRGRRGGDALPLRRRITPFLAGVGVSAVFFILIMAFSHMTPIGFLARGAYAATPPKSNWGANLFHAVTMTHYFPIGYAVIQSDAFISDGVSAAYGLIGLEPDTLLLAAFATLGLLVAACRAKRTITGEEAPAGRAPAAAAGPDARDDRGSAAALLTILMILMTWLTVGWLGPSLTRMLPILPWLALCAALFAVRLWDDLAAIRPPLTTVAAPIALIAVVSLGAAQGFSNLFLLAGRSERAMQHYGAVQTIMGMFVRTIPRDQDVVVLYTLRVDTLNYLVGNRPNVQFLTDTRHVSLDEITKRPRTITWVVEYARPFAEPLRALMMRFPQGDMSQIADARFDPDKQIFFVFTLWKDGNGNIIPSPEGGQGMPPPPGGPDIFPGADIPPPGGEPGTPPPGSQGGGMEGTPPPS